MSNEGDVSVHLKNNPEVPEHESESSAARSSALFDQLSLDICRSKAISVLDELTEKLIKWADYIFGNGEGCDVEVECPPPFKALFMKNPEVYRLQPSPRGKEIVQESEEGNEENMAYKMGVSEEKKYMDVNNNGRAEICEVIEKISEVKDDKKKQDEDEDDDDEKYEEEDDGYNNDDDASCGSDTSASGGNVASDNQNNASDSDNDGPSNGSDEYYTSCDDKEVDDWVLIK